MRGTALIITSVLLAVSTASADSLWQCDGKFTNHQESAKCHEIFSAIQCTNDGRRTITRASKTAALEQPARCNPREKGWNFPTRLFDGDDTPVAILPDREEAELAYQEADLDSAYCIIKAITGDKAASRQCGIPSFMEITDTLFPE